MKNMKRLVSMVLVLLMVFAMGTAAFATDEGGVAENATKGTITVDNPQADQEYTAYKIFDVVYNTGKTAYSYTISTDSPWYNTVNTYADDPENGLTLKGVASDSTKYVVTIDEGKFSAPKFALALQTALKAPLEVTGTKLPRADGKATATCLDLGYYFVTSTSGALCNLTTTDPTVTIHDKNDIPFDKKDDQDSVDVGTVVNYVVTGKVPDYTGFTKYMYQITDTMSEGLTFNNDVKVYIGEQEVSTNFTLKTGDAAGEYDFVLDIDVMKFAIGQKIEVKYSATVNENAVVSIENNHAILTYSSDPVTGNTKTIEDKETVYSAKIVIDKFVKDEKTKKLAGAEFILYKKDGDSTLYYKWDNVTNEVKWVTSKEDATVKTTDDTGAASFDGLKDGTYYLEEIKAPDGYNLLENAKEVIINGKDATTEDLSSLTQKVQVENSTGNKLPETGGMGTTIFYVVGGVLVLGAVVLLVTKKRMASR